LLPKVNSLFQIWKIFIAMPLRREPYRITYYIATLVNKEKHLMVKKALLLLGLVLSVFAATSTEAAAPPPTCWPCPGGH
jgi:hypothetical protein